MVQARLVSTLERCGPRARDVASVLVALAAAVAETMARRDDATVVWVAVGAVGIAGACALWWRRRYPVAVTGVGLAVVVVTGVPVVAFIGLATLAARRRDGVLAVVGAAAVVTFVATWSVDTSDGWVRPAATALLVIGFFVAVGAYVGARRDLVAALRERAARAEADQAARAEQARLAERARIAREMHDVLAHKVSLIAMHAGALEVQTEPPAEQVAASAALIGSTAREAMEDLREVLGVLRPAPGEGSDLAPPPRTADIARVVEASRAAGVPTELHLGVGELPATVARAAHRVVREGLTNVHKHARGAATVVTIVGDAAAGVSVEVRNRRPAGGPTLLPGSGAGIPGLRERVALLGGTLESGPSADGGWRLAAWLPWSHA